MDIHIPVDLGKFTDTQATIVVGAILSFITPYVSAIIIKRKMSDGTKVFISGFIAFLAACLTVVLTKQTATMADAATAFGIMWPMSQSFFKNVAMKMGLRKLEELTTPVADRPTSPPLPTTSTAEAAAAIALQAIEAPEKIADAVTDIMPANTPPVIVSMTKEQISDLVSQVLERARQTNGSE